MLTLAQALNNYQIAHLRGIASLRGVNLATSTQSDLVAELSAALADPGSIVDAVEQLNEAEHEALAALVRAGGAMTAPAFARLAGEMRQGGPAWLARTQPWLAPVSAAEGLWYRGLIARAFAARGEQTGDFVFVPADVMPWLPAAQAAPDPHWQLPVMTPTGPIHLGSYRLTLDACTLLAFVQNNDINAPDDGRWPAASLNALDEQLLVRLPPAALAQVSASSGSDRLSFLFSLAQQLGWLHTSSGRIRLSAPVARAWLQLSPPEQAFKLWEAWLSAVAWDDLRRIPTLRCEGRGWSNDPIATRRRLLASLTTVRPGVWHSVEALIAAMQTHDPDFMRSDGVYNTWYIRRPDETDYLLGFEHWPAVEGALLRFLTSGPLHWLGALDAAEDEHDPGAPVAWRLTSQGAGWLRSQTAVGRVPPAAPLRIEPNFNIYVPHSAPAFERFRVARFTQWQASQPDFCYRITQTALKRAAAAGVTTDRILAFLRQATHGQMPANVARALEKLNDQANT